MLTSIGGCALCAGRAWTARARCTSGSSHTHHDTRGKESNSDEELLLDIEEEVHRAMDRYLEAELERRRWSRSLVQAESEQQRASDRLCR